MVIKNSLNQNYYIAKYYYRASIMNIWYSSVQVELQAKAPQAIYIHYKLKKNGWKYGVFCSKCALLPTKETYNLEKK